MQHKTTFYYREVSKHAHRFESFPTTMRLFFALFLLFAELVLSSASIINIGGIFDSHERSLEVAFINAINRINNNNNSILPKTRLVPQIQRIAAEDSYQASKTVCLLLSNGVAGVFGPQSRESSVHVQSVCDHMEVPHIDTRWSYNWEGEGQYSINLFPHGPTLGRAYVDLVRMWNWRSFAIIYQDNEGLVKLKDLFQSSGRLPFNIMVKQLPVEGDFHDTLREVKKGGHLNVVVDCDAEIVYKVLKQAQQIGMMTDRHHYFITTLDLGIIDLDDFRYGGTNITSLRLVDPNRPIVRTVTDSMKLTEKAVDMSNRNFKLNTETALIFDAVYLFAKALHDLDASQNVVTQSVDCGSSQPWPYGHSLINYMKLVQLDGLSGNVGLDPKGYRSHFDLDIMELHPKGLEKIGYWSSRFKDKQVIGLQITRPDSKTGHEEYDGSLRKKFLNITTLLTDPYTMMKESTERLTGNARFEGFCVDMLEEISKELGFNYSLYLVENNYYGKFDPVTKKWNGIIGEIQNGKADLAIGDITITSQRQEAVDFSTPFMNLGISILFRKPVRAAPNLLSFLSPFSNTVWVLMGITYIGVSVMLFTIARLTPYEWDNPYPCIQDPDEVFNSFTLLNSMWFTIGSLMQQGSDIAPKASSTRAIAGIWWFFTLIMISSYTANLAAFLTIENLESPISDVKDLARQTKIKYGCVGTGSTCSFFRDSKIQLYQQMWTFMESSPQSVFVQGNAEGKAKVKKGNYAFFIESTSNEYIVERDCELTQIGGLLDSKGYGIAMQKNSPYRNLLSATILRLQEKGILSSLKTKWWKQKRGGGQCKVNSGGSNIKALDLSNVGGIFVVLIGGGCLATLVAIAEFWWKTRRIPRHQRGSMCKAMLNELIMAVRCKGTKEVVKSKEEDPPSRFSMNDEYVYSS